MSVLHIGVLYGFNRNRNYLDVFQRENEGNIMNYSEAVKYIENAGRLGSILGLSRMEKLCDLLGNPQNELSVIHIAGTNGKGSIGAMIGSILTASGCKCGMYYSPALTGITDHFVINSIPINKKSYAHCVSKVAQANKLLKDEIGEEATQFEIETAVAFVYFAENHCDAVVIECGLGGRDDATNVIKEKTLCVFASISFDHTEILGSTIGAIADVKSGIITCPCPVVMIDSGSEAVEAIRNRCLEYNAALTVVRREDISGTCDFPVGEWVTYGKFKDVRVNLSGTFQRNNAAVAIEAARALRERYNIRDCDIVKGLNDVKWPFRFEVISDNPLTIVDGAHNPGAADVLRQTILERLSGRRIIFVVGMFKDKDCESVLSRILDLGEKVITVTTPNKARALSAENLAAMASKYNKSVDISNSVENSKAKAISEAGKIGEKAVIVAFGSLSYLSEFKNGKS